MHGALSARLTRLRPRPVLLWDMTLFISSQHKWIALVVDQLSVDFLENYTWHDGSNKSAIVICLPALLRKGFVSK